MTQKLLVSQIAALKQAVQDSRLPASEFRLTEGSIPWTSEDVPAVVHDPTGFSFTISYSRGYQRLGRRDPAGSYIRRSPGIQTSDETTHSSTWDEVLDQFHLWLTLVARELGVPGVVGPTSPADMSDHDSVVWSLLHSEIVAIAKPRCEAGHFADAVEASLKHVNELLQLRCRTLTGDDLDGSKLMKRLFSVDKPVLSFGDLSTQTGKSMQVGYMEFFSGAMSGIRNPKAHANIVIDQRRALHFLFVASLLRFKIDETTIT